VATARAATSCSHQGAQPRLEGGEPTLSFGRYLGGQLRLAIPFSYPLANVLPPPAAFDNPAVVLAPLGELSPEVRFGFLVLWPIEPIHPSIARSISIVLVGLESGHGVGQNAVTIEEHALPAKVLTIHPVETAVALKKCFRGA
jgi:hypothetical protein